MKHLRLTVRVDTDAAPPFFTLLADAPPIVESRLLDWNMGGDGPATLLYSIDGDATTFAADAPETPGVESVVTSDTDGGRTYALVVLRPLETPLFAAIHRASSQPGLVVRTPILYRDGNMTATVVGDPTPLQRALDDAPDGVTVQLDEIGRFRGQRDEPVTTLSDRQREAVATALELGYYDRPRTATQADIADELDCTPQTAGEHLNAAEAKCVRAVLDDFGPSL